MSLVSNKKIVFLAIILLILVPVFVSAQEDEDGVILLEKTLPGIGEEGKVTDLGDYLNGMFLVGIGVATALAVVMITIGGTQYMMGASFGAKDAGKEKITAAIWGFVLALGAFLILNTINPDLLTFRVEEAIENLRDKIEIIPPDDTTSWPSDEPERELLSEITKDRGWGISMAKVRSSRGNVSCSKIGENGCTSLYGIDSRALNGIGGVTKQTRCEIIITAGTECWLHAGPNGIKETDCETADTKHRPGQAVVDMQQDPACLDRKILAGYAEAETTSDLGDGCYKPGIPAFGATFYWEGKECGGSTGAHWHVEF